MDGTDKIVIWTLAVGETLFLGGMFLLLPRITRRGLLFGVYVGEEASRGDEARRITRSWYRESAAWLTVSLAVCLLAGILPTSPFAVIAGEVVLVIGFTSAYLRAYRQARAMAPQQPVLPAAAPLVVTPPHSNRLPFLTGVATVLCGLLALSYALWHYAALPARIPIHFGLTGGHPDRWADKSYPAALLLPFLALFIGPALCGVAYLVAHAKRAVRYPDSGASLAAQQRFRSAMVRFVCGIALLATIMVAELSVSSIRVGLGVTDRLPGIGNLLIVALVLYALGATLYIALRFGQGGARLERPAMTAALTNGLADNRSWVLGMFYVNRDDPSVLVEHRFGLGYTLNLGNRKAVAILVGLILFALTVVLVALLAA